MLNDYEEGIIIEMMKIEQYLSHCCFVNEEGFDEVDKDFVTALEWSVNFMKNFIEVWEVDEDSDDYDLNFKIVMAKINYYENLIDICRQEEMVSYD